MAITQIVLATPANYNIFTDTVMGNTVDAVKGSSAKVYYVTVDNSANGAPSYVKLFNAASGGVTLGTTVPDDVLFVPANAILTVPFYTGSAPGKTFGTALSAACVTVGGTAGVVAPVSAVVVSIAYV